jgi:hypothetical protein
VSITKTDLLTAAKAIAQDNGADNATGLKLLLAGGHYDQAVDQALGILSQDRPNVRVYDYTVAATGFRFALSGGSAILPTSGLNAWVEGASSVLQVWHPYDATEQTDEPTDANTWRLRNLPSGVTALEFLVDQPATGDVIRIEYTSPHVVDDSDSAASSPRAGDLKALKLLTAAMILKLAANKFMQNTGNSGLPSDVVDRRSQADVCRSLAKDLLSHYQVLVGKAADPSQVGAASGFAELDVEPMHGWGTLWHPSARR